MISMSEKNAIKRSSNVVFSKVQKLLSGYPVNLWSYPTSIQFDITTKCNLDCGGCPRNLLKGTTLFNKDMDINVFKKAVPALAYINFIWLHSYGEPLMNEMFFDFLAATKKTGIKTYFYTNGMLLDREKAEKTVKLKADKVVFSLDGSTKETFEKVRKGAKFEKVIENIKGLNEAKEKPGNKKPVTELCFTVRKDNMHEMDGVIDIAKELKIKDIFYQSVLTYTGEAEDQSIYEMQKETVLKSFNKTREKAKKEGLRVRIPSIEICKKEECQIPLKMMHVRVDGKVTPCPYCAYPFKLRYLIENEKLTHKETIFNEHIVGDLNREAIKGIWNNQEYINLRKSFRDKELKKPHRMCIVPYGIH